MTPSEKYYQLIENAGFESDPDQVKAMQLLDELVLRIIQIQNRNQGFSLRKLFNSNVRNEDTKGIYFWGGVGRGKTFVMDIFFQCLPVPRKSRKHFHEFMNQVHIDLKQKNRLKNPLQTVGDEISADIDVLCLDEFVVTDIADAMILSALLESMFAKGVILVTTSNSPPQNLYHDGLQRARFLPAIDLLIEQCRIVNLDSGKDYRLQGLQQTHLYTVPHDRQAIQAIQHYLDDHVALLRKDKGELTINGREIPFLSCAEDTIWFSFSALCKSARSQKDYLEIARMFNTLIVTDIEIMTPTEDDIARRFILLIDVMYDHRVKLICTAAASAESLYQGKRLGFEFERTSSRLIEMQSEQYLSQAHTQQ